MLPTWTCKPHAELTTAELYAICACVRKSLS